MIYGLTGFIPGVILLDERGEGWIRGLGDSPGQLLELHTIEDNCGRPDIDKTGVVF